MLRPVLARLSSALERAPMDRLPPLVVDALDRMQRLIVDFLPVGARVSSRLDQLTEDVLKRVFGSARNVGVLPRRNVRTLVEFFEKHDVSGRNPAQWAELLKGIDLHAAEPITVVRFRPGDLVAQYVETGRDAGKRIGQWMVRSQGAVSHRNIGLSGGGRVRKVFRVKQEVEMLKSRAAPAADYWTAAGAKPHLALKVEDGKRVRTAAEQVAGGGDQYFLPEAWRYLEEVPSAR